MGAGKIIGGVILSTLGIFAILVVQMYAPPVVLRTAEAQTGIMVYTVVGVVFLAVGALLLIFGIKGKK